MYRTGFYDELESDEHFDLGIGAFETTAAAVPEDLQKHIRSEQNGKGYHGQLVITAHTILTEFYGLYPSIRQCYQNTNVEATGVLSS
jgi:hypothetical protein